MQASMEKFNPKRKLDEVLQEDIESFSFKKKMKGSFWLPNQLSLSPFEVTIVTNWEGKKFPSLKEIGSKPGKKDSVLFQTPTLNTVWAWVGKDGDLANKGIKGKKEPESAKCSLSLNANIDPDVLKRMPGEKKKAEEFMKRISEIIEEMYEMGYANKECWVGHKKAAVRLAKDKNETRDAKAIFMSNAECSWQKDVDRDDDTKGKMIVVKTDLTRNFRVKDADGEFTERKELRSNRPQIWKKMSTGSVADISDNLVADSGKYRPGFYPGTALRCGFEIKAWENQSKYGIRIELGPHILCIREMKKMGGKSTEETISDVCVFSDSDSDEE